MSSRFYRSFEEFAREEIRPLTRVGWSLDELDFDSSGTSEEFTFEKDEDEEEEE